MNPKQVFLSVLLFGTAGLLLFMYLQVWIEEQHTGNMQTLYSPFKMICSYIKTVKSVSKKQDVLRNGQIIIWTEEKPRL
ncbi:Chst9 [Phodopus roborovskii]|uniref:Chst9 protein n=1 Tax=Phodopus roborovskii TaxID=109678 RepID=A0AAV0A065_PHORO|nr:Chst9 [Phodopus roborovskii]